MIHDRNLAPGTQLIATYKGRDHRALVAEGGIVLDDHRTSASVSQAASLITGGSVNGWRFWTVVQAEAFDWSNDQPIDPARGEVIATASIDPAAIPPEGMTLTVPIPRAKRRSRRDAHTRELDRPVAVEPSGRSYAATELCGQGFVTAGICAECGGPLFAADRHYHERVARYYVGAEPLCCACKGHAVQGRANAEPIGATS